jgi:hypothetical protein
MSGLADFLVGQMSAGSAEMCQLVQYCDMANYVRTVLRVYPTSTVFCLCNSGWQLSNLPYILSCCNIDLHTHSCMYLNIAIYL